MAVCAAALVASCGVAGAYGEAGRGPAASPGSPVLGYRLAAVAAVPGAGAWAVGLSSQGSVHAIRWDGRAWRPVPAPGGGDLYGVAALSAADAWAVGYGAGNTAVIERWNGRSWALVPSPARGYLAGVTATSARNAWAVGTTGLPLGRGTGIIEHWNGTSWTCISATGTAGPCPPG